MSIKKVLSIFSAGIITVSVLLEPISFGINMKTAFSAETDTTEALKNALEQQMQKQGEFVDPNPLYALYDVNSDGIDELFISYRNLENIGSDMYVYSNGSYVFKHNFYTGAKICPSENLFMEKVYGGGEMTTIYVLTEYGLKQKDELKRLYPDFYHNGYSVKESEYEKVLSQYENKNWIRVPENSRPVSDFLSELNNLDPYKAEKEKILKSVDNEYYSGKDSHLENAPSDMVFYDIDDELEKVQLTNYTIYDSPSNDGNEIYSYMGTNTLRIVGENNDWYYLVEYVGGGRFNHPQYGYISKALVNPITTTTTTSTTTTTTTTSSILSGKCGDNLSFSLDSNGRLTISGKGDMYNYSKSSSGEHPWHDNYRDITEVVIENGVISIGKYSFEGCTNLTTVTIPDSVTSIGAYAFWGCRSLTSITIPDSVTSIRSFAFSYCSSLKSVTIPDSVTSIGSFAFRGCTSLTSVSIPDSVTSIGDYAFGECTSLTSVSIPDSVTSIGDNAFWECTRLTSVSIPDSVTSIGSSAFRGCTNLTFVTIPNGVTSIRAYAFENCSSLKSVTIPDSVTSISNMAFYNCTNLTSVTIPDSVTSIGAYAFWGCRSLTSITIPDSVTSIGSSAFSGCTNLTFVTIPDGVTSIGDYAFSGCSSLTSVSIPDSVTSIGDYAFWGCTSLTIICNAGSATEKYAKKNRIPYKEYKISLLPGDVNNDSSVNIADVVSLQNFLLGRTKTLGNWKNADLCEDNRLDGFDMILMRRLLIEKMQS